MARTLIADVIETIYITSKVFVLEVKFVYGSSNSPGHSISILATAFTSHSSLAGSDGEVMKTRVSRNKDFL